ncbi:MAG TPA: DEAD/DEAH box helicase [Edaphobacter sp.]
MGKTFVAFAVAVSVIHATGGRQPVVVMVPPAVSEKWPRDWSVFEKYCLSGGPPIRASSATVRRGSDFLKLLDDPKDRRHDLIFLTHGALSRSLNDPFIRLAIVRQAFLFQRLRSQRNAFPKWAARLLNDLRFTPERTRRLLDTQPETWSAEWARGGSGGFPEDDLVPTAALDGLSQVDLQDLQSALAWLPVRASPNIDDRLRETRQQLFDAVQNVWSASLRHLREHLPLLILDEAHHVKNTNLLARLFDSAEAQRDADVVSGNGPLAGMFERMLFLTATPFQLGHRELISVLGRFSGARLSSSARTELGGALETLTKLLDSAQASSLRLERAWGRLTPEDLADLPPDWWDTCPDDAADIIRAAAVRTRESREALGAAAEALRPWVVRHLKDKLRMYRPGQQMENPKAANVGIEVSGPAVMPFLLSARAQALVSLHGLKDHQATRAYFADGLASSFEAFAETRLQHVAEVDDIAEQSRGELPADVQWYVDRISSALPDTDPGNWSRHPKLRATTNATRELWRQGDKVLIFCFYRATGRALRSHISRALLEEVAARGADALSMDPGDQLAILAALEQRGNSLLRAEAPGARLVAERVRGICTKARLGVDDTDQTIDVVTRFMRTASFLTRFVDLRARRGVDAIAGAFDRQDGAGAKWAVRISDFVKLVKGLTDEERAGLWEALRGVQTGSISTITAGFYDPGETSSRREATLPNVRLANGTVRAETRQRLMRTFNTPFFPEVLVASSVMAEGVDLHIDCSHVIHYDLDWNPSTLEQRTGRLDRLGSKAERNHTNIMVFEPYMAGTQDEKMYRVVKDRERWFNVVMGEQLDSSEWATDLLAKRVPLPDSLVKALSVDLSVGDHSLSAESPDPAL